jgi:superfamily II DNA or RNA helicase
MAVFATLNPLPVVDYEDRRVKTLPRKLSYPIDADILPNIILRDDYQTHSVQLVLESRRGLIDVPTRGGKTEIILAVIAHFWKYENPDAEVTVLAKDNNLVDNLCARLKLRGFEYSKFNQDGGDVNSKIIVCVVNTAYNAFTKYGSENPLTQRLLRTKILIVDETHHATGHMFATVIETMLKSSFPDIILPVSGTPFIDTFDQYSNIRDVQLIGMTGGVIVRVNDEFLIERGYKARGNVIFLEPKAPYQTMQYKIYNYTQMYRKYIRDLKSRNDLAISSIIEIVKRDLRVLVLVKEIEHGKKILSGLGEYSHMAVFKAGTEGCFTRGHGDKEPISSEYWNTRDQNPEDNLIAGFNRDEFKILIGTTIFNTGTDFPGCNWAVLLAGEGKENDILNRQRASRIQCANKWFNHGFIIDFIDSGHIVTSSQSKGRIKFYQGAGFNLHSSFNSLVQLLDLTIKHRDEYRIVTGNREV